MSDEPRPLPEPHEGRQVGPRPGDRYRVPAEGSLGLLALGARGLDAWRAARRAAGVDLASSTTGEKPEAEVSEFDALMGAVDEAQADAEGEEALG